MIIDLPQFLVKSEEKYFIDLTGLIDEMLEIILFQFSENETINREALLKEVLKLSDEVSDEVIAFMRDVTGIRDEGFKVVLLYEVGARFRSLIKEKEKGN